MSDPFTKYGIEHLSASSLNLYAEEPAYWTLVYLHKLKDEGNSRTWRGSAVEAGLDLWLYKRDLPAAIQAAMQRFEESALGDLTEDVDRERESIKPMLEGACKALQKKPEPITRQLKIEYYFDGIEVPVIGYTDYEWEDEGLDLKTTNRMPSEMSPRHSRQLALYQVARKKPYCGLYVTAKKVDVKYVADAELHVKRLEWYAHSIRRLLSVFPDKHDASRIFAPKFESFYWSNEAHRDAALEIWG